ncbi:MAG: inositol monophosphatase family protein [Anaerolineales bacterium]
MALERGARITRGIRPTVRATSLAKPDHSPVSAADYAVQAVTARLLEDLDPSVSLIAEEDAGALRGMENAGLRSAVVKAVRRFLPAADEANVLDWVDRGRSDRPAPRRYWTLDPVDGTKAFIGRGQYAVALALIEAGQVVLGGLACPELSLGADGRVVRSRTSGGIILLASAGEGTWLRSLRGRVWRRVSVSAIDDSRRARMLISVETAHLDPDWLRGVRSHLGIRRAPTRMDSQAKFGLLAAGAFDLILRLPRREEPEKIWDYAASDVIVHEAGGVVTDLHGNRLRFDSGAILPNPSGLIATSPNLHPLVLGAVRAVKVGRG